MLLKKDLGATHFDFDHMFYLFDCIAVAVVQLDFHQTSLILLSTCKFLFVDYLYRAQRLFLCSFFFLSTALTLWGDSEVED